MTRRDVPSNFGLAVFDLDYTLWDAGGTWCDCLSPPFTERAGKVVDRRDRWVRLYDDVLPILDHLDDAGVPMALASRTSEPAWARELLDLLEIRQRFAFEEIYPSEKTAHFAALQKDSGIDYAEMVFFDDEHRNIVDVSALGVTCVHVTSGMSWGKLEEGQDRVGP